MRSTRPRFMTSWQESTWTCDRRRWRRWPCSTVDRTWSSPSVWWGSWRWPLRESLRVGICNCVNFPHCSFKYEYNHSGYRSIWSFGSWNYSTLAKCFLTIKYLFTAAMLLFMIARCGNCGGPSDGQWTPDPAVHPAQLCGLHLPRAVRVTHRHEGDVQAHEDGDQHTGTSSTLIWIRAGMVMSLYNNWV